MSYKFDECNPFWFGVITFFCNQSLLNKCQVWIPLKNYFVDKSCWIHLFLHGFITFFSESFHFKAKPSPVKFLVTPALITPSGLVVVQIWLDRDFMHFKLCVFSFFLQLWMCIKLYSFLKVSGCPSVMDTTLVEIELQCFVQSHKMLLIVRK